MTVITEDLPELNNRVLVSKKNFDKFNNPGVKYIINYLKIQKICLFMV